MDVLATNKILYGLIYAPILLVLYAIMLFVILSLKTDLNSMMRFNICVVFVIVFPFYIRYSIEHFDTFVNQSRILIIRMKHFFANKLAKHGINFYFYKFF